VPFLFIRKNRLKNVAENPVPNLVIPALIVHRRKKSPVRKIIVWRVVRIAAVRYVHETTRENVTSKIFPKRIHRKSPNIRSIPLIVRVVKK
jgi:hypothetical protein